MKLTSNRRRWMHTFPVGEVLQSLANTLWFTECGMNSSQRQHLFMKFSGATHEGKRR